MSSKPRLAFAKEVRDGMVVSRGGPGARFRVEKAHRLPTRILLLSPDLMGGRLTLNHSDYIDIYEE